MKKCEYQAKRKKQRIEDKEEEEKRLAIEEAKQQDQMIKIDENVLAERE